MFWGPLAELWLRPWFDRVALDAITRWYMPMSRAWAAGLASGGNPERFRAELSIGRGETTSLPWALSHVARQARAYASAERRWSKLSFQDSVVEAAALADARRRRDRAAQSLTLSRGAFLPLILSRHVPPVRWELPSRTDVALRHGARLTGEDSPFPPPLPPRIELSQFLVRGDGQREHWLRFEPPVPDSGGAAFAHVCEPAASGPIPTLIFLHGICYESEFMPSGQNPIRSLADRGFRLVMPEAPWHGRRRLSGRYGGEPVIGRAPLGFLSLFEAWVAEIAILIDWARRTATGPVALGGVSLGALTSQLVATAARDWPATMRPDGLMLVATSGEIGELMSASSLGRELGLPEQLAARGWTADAVSRWLPLASPVGAPGLNAERIVVVLGKQDQITPFRGGLALADRWRVPAENRFVWDRGHFSTGLGIGADHGPVTRLKEILG